MKVRILWELLAAVAMRSRVEVERPTVLMKEVERPEKLEWKGGR